MGRTIIKPTILDSNQITSKNLKKLRNKEVAPSIHDIYDLQLQELYEIESVGKKISFSNYKNKKYNQSKELSGSWVFYPWLNTLVHMLGSEDYYTLRTNRNRELVTKTEQEKLRKSKFVILGLSIGSVVFNNLIQQGIGSTFKLFDFDTIDTTNLNRMPANIFDVGSKKIDAISKKAYELDPFIDIYPFSSGLTEDNINLCLSEPKPSIIFEAIDDLKMKIKIRLLAKKNKIPVLMFTNLFDSVLVDIERYDINPDLDLFNGSIKDVSQKILETDIDSVNINSLVTKIVEKRRTPVRALESLSLIGKKLIGRPQLSSTVNVSGALGAYFARKIILGETTYSGRKQIKFDSFIK